MMKAKILTIRSSLLIVAVSCNLAFANEEIVCPNSVTIKYAKPDLNIVPEGWEVSEKGYDKTKIKTLAIPEDIAKSPIYIERIEIYAGQSLDTAEPIMPKTATINGKKYKNVWSLDSTNSHYWANCVYSYNDEVQINKSISAELKTCRANYSTVKNRGAQAKLVCSTEKLK